MQYKINKLFLLVLLIGLLVGCAPRAAQVAHVAAPVMVKVAAPAQDSLPTATDQTGAAAVTVTASPSPTSLPPTPTATITPTPDTAWIAPLAQMVDAAAQSGPLPGIVVGVRLGSQPPVIHAYGAADIRQGDPVTADTPFQIASLTKQFTAAAVMQLVAAGKLDLDAPVAHYLTGLPAAAQAVTLRSLLTHTSGLPDLVGAKIRSYEVGEPIDPDDSRVDLAQAFAAPLSPPGAAYRYNNTGFYILGRVIEQVSGLDYAAYLQQHILTPLGLDHTSFCAQPPPGAAQGYAWDAATQTFHPLKNDLDLVFSAGGLCSSARDLLAWQQALSSGQVVSPQAYAQMTTPNPLSDGTATSYGFGLNVTTAGGQVMISHGGAMPGFRAALVDYPARDLAIVVLANSETVAPEDLAAKIAALINH